jgi:hypothetical protein
MASEQETGSATSPVASQPSPPPVTSLPGRDSQNRAGDRNEMSQSPKSPAENQDRQDEDHAPLQVDVSLSCLVPTLQNDASY